MSKVIDERVVSMQFDNRQFESNVKTTMSTLEKLKRSLNLSGASKGLEGIGAAAKKIDMSPISAGADAIAVKFKFLDRVWDQVQRNIIDKAQAAGERLAKSLTITPITTGFNEYELKMGAIQTIIASTGESLATVNEYLNELNKYSDQTIYSFQDMTQNIGKFTNAGVKLEDAVLAIKGIANEAALSGANANEASRAMYNFAQALSTGYVQRIDWKSIELANMATVEFKEQLLESAVAMGSVEKNAQGMWRAVGDDTWYNTSQMFIETLDEQWLTSKALINTLKDYADETTDIGKRASEAATQVKTFTMLMDTLKESAQSGWATTWETIVGDFNESKNLFTSLSKVIGGWLDASSNARNNFLSEVLDSNWEKTIKQLNKVGVSTEEFEEALRGVIKNSDKANKSLKDKNKTLDELIEEYGSLRKIFESGFFSSDLLVDAVDEVSEKFEELGITIDGIFKKGSKGDDVTQIQKILKAWGADLGEFGKNLDGIDGKFGSVTQAAVRAFQEKQGLTVDGIVGPETIAALEKVAEELNEANKESKGLVGNVKDLVKNIDNLGGRQKLLNAFSTLWTKLGDVIDAVKKGWNNIFDDVNLAGKVTSVIDKFSEWVDQINITKDTLSDITSIVSGFASAIQTGAILGGGLFGVLNKIVNTAVRFAGLDLISILGDIGDALVKFRQFLVDDNALGDFLDAVGTKLASGLEAVYKGIGWIADGVKTWFSKFLALEHVQDILSRLSTAFTDFRTRAVDWFGGVGAILKHFFTTLSSLDEITFESVWKAVKNLGSALVDQFGSLESAIIPIIKGVKDLGLAFIDALGLKKPFDDLINWIDRAKTAYLGWVNGTDEYKDLPAKVAKSIADGIGGAVNVITKVFQTLGSKIWTAITGTSLNFDSTGAEIGASIVIGIANGIWNGIKFIGAVISELGKIVLGKLNEVLVAHGFEEIPVDMITGFVNGIRSGVSDAWAVMIEFGKTVLAKIKEVLGIHSPSTEMESVGQNTMLGFIDGVKELLPVVWDLFKQFGQKIIDLVMDIDLGQILAMILAGGTMKAISKISNAIVSFSNLIDAISGIAGGVTKVLESFSGVLNGIKGITTSISGYIDAKKMVVRAEAMKSFAIAIAILAAAVIALTFIEPGKLWAAIGAITALAIIMGGLTLAIDKLGSGKEGATKIGKFALLVVSFGVVIFMMSKVVKQIAKLSWDELSRGCAGLIVFSGLMVGLIAATNLIAKTAKGDTVSAVFKVGSMLLGIAAAIVVFAIAGKLIASMDWGELAKAGTGLVVLSGIMVGLIAATNLLAKSAKGDTATAVYKVGSMLLGIAAAFMVLVLTAKIIAGMDTGDMIKAGVGLLALGGFIVGLIAATKLAGKDVDKVGGTIFKIAAAMLLLSVTAKIIATMKWGDMAKAAVGLVGLGAIITGLVWVTNLASEKDILKAGVMLLFMSFAISILAVIATLFGMLNIEHIAKGVVAVGLLGLVMAAMIWATRGATDCAKNITAMATAIAVMAIAAVALSFIKPDKLTSAVVALGSLMFMFAVLIKVADSATASIGTIIVLAGVIALFAGILYLLASFTDVDKCIGVAAALSVLMLTLSGVLLILRYVGHGIIDALFGVGALLALAVPLFAFVKILSSMQNIQNATQNVMTLIVFTAAMTLLLVPLTLIGSAAGSFAPYLGVLALLTMAIPLIAFVKILSEMQNVQNAVVNANILINLATAMTLLLVPLTLIGSAGMSGTPYLGVLALLTMVVPLLAFVGVLAAMQNIQNAESNAKLLVTMMTSFTAICAVLTIVGAMGASAFIGIGALLTLIASVGTLVAGIGALVDKFPALETFLDTGIPILEKIGFAIGSFSGNILGGLAKGVTDGLPAIGTNLAEFMTNAKPFVDGIKTVDESAMSGVKAIADTILILTKADILDGLTSWMTGGSSITNFGEELAAFGPKLKVFADSVAGIDTASVTAAADAAKTLAEMANLVPNEGGVAAWFAGENSLSAFGPQIASFGMYLKQFADNVSGVDAATITAAADAGKALVEMANTVPNEGGVAAWFSGENSLATFSSTLPGLGTNMALFVTNLGSFTDEQVSTVKCVASALQELATATNTIPNEGGIAAWFAGENSLTAFSANLPSLGTNMASFVTNLGTFTEDQVTTVKCVASALKELAIATETLPNEGGMASWFGGDSSLASFSANLPGLGTNMASFVSNLGTFTETQVTTVYSAINAIKAFATLADSDLSGAKKHIEGFGDKLAGFGSDISDFCSELGGETNVSSAVSNMNKIVDAAKSITDGSVSAVKDLGKALKDFGKNGVTGFVSAFTSEESKKSVSDAAAKLAEKVVDGAETKEASIKKAFSDLASAGASAIKTEDVKAKFTSAGKYVVTGFASGITENSFKAEAAATAMASAALAAAKEVFDEHSPSREFFKIGRFVVEGLANGIAESTSMAVDSSGEMANNVLKGTHDILAKVSDYVVNGIDTEPTIRPVLDMSDLTSKAGKISGLFDMNPSVGLMTNIGAISRGMNGRQNGTATDIINELSNLGKKLENAGGNTYNSINGITYSDGSELSEAIQTIVRLATIERRV